MINASHPPGTVELPQIASKPKENTSGVGEVDVDTNTWAWHPPRRKTPVSHQNITSSAGAFVWEDKHILPRVVTNQEAGSATPFSFNS